MSAITISASWIDRYTSALEAKSLSHQVGPFNDITVTVEDAEYVVRNTASVVPQRIHLVGYPTEPITADPDQLESVTVKQQFDDMTIRARGRALPDHQGRVYFDLICVAGEPGDVPAQERLERLLPQLFVLMTQMQQQLRD
ncbi:hypothetical protein [Nesterenkonia pannonica]|uniref:hypothetical protein n=1 Tax=Nesterenkonia pannonica TaxID=1548602 RepID=UPI0021647080|nr:hypothetical protein [Nesterenkonia pannonica]